jgi:hypothetical protein
MGIGPANIILDDSVGNEQLRILGPGYSKTMNLDHDGDTLGLAVHNAANAMRKSGKNAAEIEAAMASIERNALDDLKVISRMVSEGDAFKLDNISDIYYNEAMVFKTYQKDGDKGYDKAYDDFLSSIGLNRETLKEQGYAEEAVDFMAAYSPQMRKAINIYNAENGNFLKSAQARIAALKAKTNKENIGIISNASFALHDAAVTAFSKATTEAEKKRIAELHGYLDYISPKGMDGLLTIAEQKGIDTKHILNATEITNVSLFSKGMRGLMNTNTIARQNNLENSMVNIMQSINNALFNKGSRDELLEIARDILSTSMEEYSGRISATQDKELVKDLILRQQLRAMYELSEYDAVRTAYNSPFRRFKTYENFMKGLTDLDSYNSGVNTVSKVSDAYKATSGAKLGLDTDTVYVSGGGLVNNDKGYILSPYKSDSGEILKRSHNGTLTLRLEEVNLTESLPHNRYKYFRGKSIEEIQTKVNKFLARDAEDNFVSISVRDFKAGTNELLLDTFNANRRKARAYNVLSSFFSKGVDDNIEQYFQMGGNRTDPLSSKAIQKLYQGVGDEYFNLIDRFAQTTKQEDLWKIQRLHEFMGTKNSSIRGMTYGGLIKKVNQDIVNNPQNYANASDTASYMDAVEHVLKNIIKDDELYKQYKQDFLAIGDLDIKSYNAIVDLLRGNVYDIMSEKQMLTEGIDNLKQYESYGIESINNFIKNSSQTVDTITNTLSKTNINNIRLAETNAYKLFSSTKQMTVFFNWKNASKYSKVGFGEYLGYDFRQLSQKDIDKIFEFSKQHASHYLESGNAVDKFAYQRTMELLEEWQKQGGVPAKKNAIPYKISKATSDALNEINNLQVAGDFHKSIQEVAEEMQQAEKGKKKRLTDVFTDNASKAKDIFDKIPKKALGIGVASLAAIGIVNNVLSKKKSPLTPARRPGGNSSPSYNSPSGNAPMQAPMSKQRTIYHDRGSGFNFKVSASTRNYIDDQNNAKLIGMSGGGNPSIYSQKDMSGVTDNWLANKFAELT